MTYGEVQTLFPVADAAFLASYEWHHADGRLTGAVLRQSAGIRRWDLFTVEDPEPALGAIRLIDLSRSDWDHRVTSCMWTRLSDSERVSVGREEGSTPADSFLEDLEHARLTDQPNSGAAGQNLR